MRLDDRYKHLLPGNDDLAKKLYLALRQHNYPAQTAALVAYLLGEKGWTAPEIGAVTVTSDGWLLHNGNVLGAVSAFEADLSQLISQAGLNPSEEVELFTRYQEKMFGNDHRPGRGRS